MRLTTHIWARFESKGYPDSTIETEEAISVLEVAKLFLKFLSETPMNKRIVATLAPTKDGLDVPAALRANKGLDEFDSFMLEVTKQNLIANGEES